MIEYKLNQLGQKIPFFLSGALHDFEDPAEEAAQWVREIASRRGLEEQINVLGLGGGYHVLELAKAMPKLKIVVYEFDPQLVEQFANPNADKIEVVLVDQNMEQNNYAGIDEKLFPLRLTVPFQRSWIQHLSAFRELFLYLTLRHQVSLKKYCLKAGVRPLVPLESLDLSQFTINDVHQNLEINSGELRLAHLSLMELIR